MRIHHLKSLTILKVATTLFIVCVAMILFFSCQKNHEMDPVDCSGPAKSFATDVNPIIQSACATNSGCHDAASSNGPGALVNFTQVFNAPENIRSAVGSGHMPPNRILLLSERSAIVCWIDNGALNN